MAIPKYRLYFRESRSSYEQITELYNFIWPCAAALWNLRWQVQGITAIGLDDKSIQSRFLSGSDVQGADLRTSCLDRSWEQQKEQFSKFLLVDLFAIYEGWLETLLKSIGESRRLKDLQFPSNPSSATPTSGIGRALREMGLNSSTVMQSSIQPYLRRHRKNSLTNLESLMICYRFFKECRNSLMHRHGKADVTTENASRAYANVTASHLGMKEKPIASALIAGDDIHLSLRGVVGFSDVILRLIATLDAELAVNRRSETELITQLKDFYVLRRMLPSLQPRRDHAISRMLMQIGFGPLHSISGLEQIMIAGGVVTAI